MRLRILYFEKIFHAREAQYNNIMDIRETYKFWIENAKDEKVAKMLEGMAGDEKAIEDAFFKELAFGTGGLRGKLGAGTNRMNVYTVGRAAFGLADYINKTAESKSVAIAYDSRMMSAEFARLSAEILSSKGIKAYLFDTLMPTPVLSFAVRELKAGAGVVVTASHNPKEYNGYKVYNEKGCQLTDEAAAAVTKEIEKYGYFNSYAPDEALIELIGEDMLEKFLSAVLSFAVPQELRALPKIVYTPLCGTGYVPVTKLFERLGVKDYVVVPEQRLPDGNFTTCPYPNPEEKAAMSLAVELAKKEGAGLAIATDPDADRVGIAVLDEKGDARLMSGNETGVLVENFIFSVLKEKGIMPEAPYMVKTIVTTPLAESVAEGFGVNVKNVLTGFKYIGEAIDRFSDESFIFGMEESYGYLVGKHARDKDSVSAVTAIIGAYAYYTAKGLTLTAALDGLYRKYGYFETGLISKTFEGKSGMEFMSNFMTALREKPFAAVCGKKVTSVKDYLLGTDGLPKSNVMCFKGEEFCLIARPSGTEPKIKFYLTAKGNTKESACALLTELNGFVETLFRA